MRTNLSVLIMGNIEGDETHTEAMIEEVLSVVRKHHPSFAVGHDPDACISERCLEHTDGNGFLLEKRTFFAFPCEAINE